MNWGDPRLPERFWSKVAPEPNSSCWLWISGVCTGGYGSFKLDGATVSAHRLTFLAEHGYLPDPETRDLDHFKCQTRSCCNPSHLEDVTKQENTLRGNGPAALNARKTSCLAGHEYTPQNTQIVIDHGKETRRCITCRKARDKLRPSRALLEYGGT